MQGHLFIGELWVPSLDIPSLEQALTTVKQSNAHHPGGQLALKQPPPGITIPTYFHLNDFTTPFQLIINTYGVPRYQEINPALLTCITFPFLFGVMFGDIGHGTALFCFGIYLCYNHNPNFHPYRYLIALMGFFSIYAGFIYNDFVGMALNLFGSCYNDNGVLLEQKKSDCNYPFGIDPAWQSTLEFGDSVKMKFSVIIALLHMCLGIVMQGMNQIHKQDYLGFTCKFIPQMIFMLCIFGYMDFLIIYKWLVQFTPTTAPSIINTIIAMVLELGKVDGLYMWEGTSQETIQSTLIAIAIITVPWMWLPRILMACVESQPKQSLDYGQLDEEPSVEIQMQELHYNQHPTEIMTQSPPESALLDTQIPSHHNNHHQDEFTEIVVHETIETIEFVLGSVSNTASYLRLWALSLAHSQLAEVFYQLILAESVEDGQTLGMIVAFPSWAMFTFGVLLCMDTMECFLHSLRLHWVEFQSKFYKGDGVQFQVYSFKQSILN